MRPAVLAAGEREQRRAVTKEQLQREAEEHELMLKKEKLMREIELGALTTRRYRPRWRQMMIKIKMPQIIEDVEVAWRNFDRSFDIKDHRISLLMDELAEAEEQCQRGVRSHTETIDRLLKSYRERMEREERDYRSTLNETLGRTDDEVDGIRRRQNEGEVLLQSITRGVRRQLEESLNNAKSVALSKIDAFVEDSKDVRRLSATHLENQLRSCWEDLRKVLSDYQNRTKDRRKYEALKEKDERGRRVIAQQLLRTASLFEEIRRFRGKIATYEATAKSEISEISTEHDFFQKTYWTVKDRLLSEQTKDTEQLKVLSVEYNKTIKHLQRLVTKGERLLTLMQICRKYETQDEKVIPFVGQAELEDSSAPPSRQFHAPSDVWEVSRQIADFQDLTNFWRRLGLAQIITTQLRSERDRLKVEANYLRDCLSFYMMQKRCVCNDP